MVFPNTGSAGGPGFTSVLTLTGAPAPKPHQGWGLSRLYLTGGSTSAGWQEGAFPSFHTGGNHTLGPTHDHFPHCRRGLASALALRVTRTPVKPGLDQWQQWHGSSLPSSPRLLLQLYRSSPVNWLPNLFFFF